MLLQFRREFLSRIVFAIAVFLAGSFPIPAQKPDQSPTPTPSPKQEKQEPDEDRVYWPKEVDVKAKIPDRPEVWLNNECRARRRLTVRVRTVLRKSGQVTDTELVMTSGCSAYDENAISAVNKIKFIPAMKDGRPVSQAQQFEFQFVRL